jgi:hypothetical protein
MVLRKVNDKSIDFTLKNAGTEPAYYFRSAQVTRRYVLKQYNSEPILLSHKHL